MNAVIVILSDLINFSFRRSCIVVVIVLIVLVIILDYRSFLHNSTFRPVTLEALLLTYLVRNLLPNSLS